MLPKNKKIRLQDATSTMESNAVVESETAVVESETAVVESETLAQTAEITSGELNREQIKNKLAYNYSKERHKRKKDKYNANISKEMKERVRQQATASAARTRAKIHATETPEEKEARIAKETEAKRKTKNKKRAAMGLPPVQPRRFRNGTRQKSSSRTPSALSTQSIFAQPTQKEIPSSNDNNNNNNNNSSPELPIDLSLRISMENPVKVTKFLKDYQTQFGGPNIQYISPKDDQVDMVDLVRIDALETEGNLEFFGLIATKTIDKGKRLFLGTGEIISSTKKEDENSNYKTDVHSFTVDSKKLRSPHAFINHSVQNANVITRRVYSRKKNKGLRITGFEILAKRKIEKDEQLLADYGEQFTRHLAPGRKFIFLNTTDNELSSKAIFETHAPDYLPVPVKLTTTDYPDIDAQFFKDFDLDPNKSVLLPRTTAAILKNENYIFAYRCRNDLPLLENNDDKEINPLPNYQQKNITSFIIAAYFGNEKYITRFVADDKNIDVQERQSGKSLLYYTVIGRGSVSTKVKLIEQLSKVGIHISAFYEAFYAAIERKELDVIKALIIYSRPNVKQYMFLCEDATYEHGVENDNFKFDDKRMQKSFSGLTEEEIAEVMEVVGEASIDNDVTTLVLDCLCDKHQDNPEYRESPYEEKPADTNQSDGKMEIEDSDDDWESTPPKFGRGR